MKQNKKLINLVKKLNENQIKINYYGTNSPDKLKKLFAVGVEFPLVDKVAEMMEVAKEHGIHPAKPEY